MAAAVAFTGTAMANNTQTINQSEGYVDLSIAAAFIPEFVSVDCTTALGSTGGNCNDHGAVAAANAAGTTIVFAGGGSEANAGYFNNADMMPVLNMDTWSGGIQHAAWKNAPPFSSGLMGFDRSDSSSYFAGLDLGWTGYSKPGSGRGSEIPMGAPIMPGGSESARDQWVDQTIVGYVQSLTAPGTGTVNYEQNFRSQLSWMGTSLPGIASTFAHIDQRLEQDLTLTDTPRAFEASRQTLQTAFAVNSRTGATTDPEGGQAGAGSGVEGAIGLESNLPPGKTVVETQAQADTEGIGQLVTQDIEGWFYSCLNCDSTANNVSHAFTPFETHLSFMPYTNTWRDLPSISHGGAASVRDARNLRTYATAPGQVGP